MAKDLKTPSISVVMSVYNGQQYLRAAIESVLKQTFKDFEFIIVNDGSTDDTKQLIDEYAQKDARIRVLNQPNHGLVRSLNRGIEVARGQYIARHDADDISDASRLQKEYDYLQAHPATAIVGSAYVEIDDASKELRTVYMPTIDEEIRLHMYFAHVFAHGSVMLRRAAWEKAGGYRQDYWPGEDLDLWRRIASYGKLANLSEPLYKYRMNEQGISLSNLERQQAKIGKIHEELRQAPKLLLANKNFLAVIQANSPARYSAARRQAKMLVRQLLKRRRIANARFLIVALGKKRTVRPSVLMVSPTQWLGGGEVYTEAIIRGLSATYAFYLWSGQKLRRRLSGSTHNFNLPLFPFGVKRILKRTRPLEELYYRGLSQVRVRFSDLSLIDIQAYEPSVLNALSKQKNVPVIFTAHTRFRMREPAERAFVCKTLSGMAKIICVSEAAKKDLQQIGIELERCVVIHNGVDTKRFVPAAQPGQYVTWIGRIEAADKNPMLFVDIAREAKQAGSALQFRMVGDGSMVAEIRAVIAAESLDNLELTGFEQDMTQVYHQAAVVCLTSTSESLPLVILEAMSAGVPVVSSNVGGVGEIISSQALGKVLNSWRPQDFYQAIAGILSSDASYKQLSKRVRAHIVENFSQQKMLSQTKDLFDRVISAIE